MTGNVGVNNSTLVGVLSVVACVYFCMEYRRLGGQHIGFPIYIYFAMFPHKLRAFSIFSADDMILKMVLITDLLLFLLRNRKVRCNVYEIFFLLAVCVVDMAAYIGIQEVNQSLLITGLVNILFMFVFSFAFRNRVVTPGGMNATLGIIIRNGALLSIGAILETVIYAVERAELGLNNPNYLAYYLAIAFCAFTYNISSLGIKELCYGALIVVGITCTGSYSVLICFPLYFLVKTTYRMSPNTLKPVYTRFFSVVLLLIAVTIVWMSTSKEIMSIPLISNILDVKDTERLHVWKEALRDWQDSPILGVGYNCWRSNYGIGYVTHNDYLRLLVETGLIGLGVFLWYWFELAKKIAKSKWENQPFYISLMLTILLFSCFHNNMNSLMFWIVLSLPIYDDLVFLRIDKQT